MKGKVETVSGTSKIINVERFSCLKRMLKVISYDLRFCLKLFKD